MRFLRGIVLSFALLLIAGLLACTGSRTIETNPHTMVRSDTARIARASREWLRSHGYTVVSWSEYRIKGSKELSDVFSFVSHGGKATHFIELIRYPKGDSTEIDLFAYTIDSSLYARDKQEVETDKDKLADYQQQLDTLAMTLR